MNIYSFLPSATETIYALGLGDQLRGVTHECDYPPAARQKPVVIESIIDTSKMDQREIDERVVESMSHGQGLYRINKKVLRNVKPDVVITQELCDVCSVTLKDVLKTISELAEECKVVSLKPRGLAGVLEGIITVGRACGVEKRARGFVKSLEARIETVRRRSSGLAKRRVFCVEWFDPLFASGHWVPEMVDIAGGVDSLARPGLDSRKISWAEVQAYDPDVLILAPCGFDLRRTLLDLPTLTRLEGWGRLAAVRDGKVFAANGSAYYSRPGPRLVDGLELMARMIHPEVFGGELPDGAAAAVSREFLVATS